jgi:hypothetical protein
VAAAAAAAVTAAPTTTTGAAAPAPTAAATPATAAGRVPARYHRGKRRVRDHSASALPFFQRGSWPTCVQHLAAVVGREVGPRPRAAPHEPRAVTHVWHADDLREQWVS